MNTTTDKINSPELEKQNDELKREVAELTKQNLSYRRKSIVQDTVILLTSACITAFLSFLIKNGIDVSIEKYFENNRETIIKFLDNFIKGSLRVLEYFEKSQKIAKIVSYAAVCLVAFPIICCIISNYYTNVKCVDKQAHPKKEENNAKEETEWGKWIKNWGKNFVNKENRWKNFIYYSCVGIVASLFFCLQHFVVAEGINKTTEEITLNLSGARLALKISSVIAFAMLSALFAISLRGTLWKEQIMEENSSDTQLENVTESQQPQQVQQVI